MRAMILAALVIALGGLSVGFAARTSAPASHSIDVVAPTGDGEHPAPTVHAIAGGVGLGGACRVTSQCAGSLQCVRGVCGCTNNSQCNSKVAPGRPWCRNGMCQK